MLEFNQIYKITRSCQMSWEEVWDLKIGTEVVLWVNFPRPRGQRSYPRPCRANIHSKKNVLRQPAILLNVKEAYKGSPPVELYRNFLSSNYLVTTVPGSTVF